MGKRRNDMILDMLFADMAKTQSRQNCYWYTEWHDMGATVPQCSLEEMGKCPCKNCDNYLDASEARGVVMKYFLEKKGKK